MRIDLSGQSFVFPDKCACCGQPPDSELAASASKSSGKKVVHTKTNVWDFPYCGRCVGHVKSAEGARAVAWILGILSIVLGLFLGYAVNATTGMVIGFLAIIGTGLIHKSQMAQARAQCSVDCVCVGRAMAYLGWHGTLHQFDVHSPHFARDFVVANQSKLVNLSTQAKNLLAGAGATVKTSGRTPRRYMS
jgi:hypothetical protein